MSSFLRRYYLLLLFVIALFLLDIQGNNVDGKQVTVNLLKEANSDDIDDGNKQSQNYLHPNGFGSNSENNHFNHITNNMKNNYSSMSLYFILSGILILISILSTYLIRECVVDRIRRKSDSFLQTVMDTVFRQAACIFVSLAISYCILTSRFVDHVREICESLMSEYSKQTIINNLATQIDTVIVKNSRVWTAENLGHEFNNILAIVILTFAWYCLFVLYFTGCVKFLEKWIRYADETDVGVLIKSIFDLQNLFSLKHKRFSEGYFGNDVFKNSENRNSDESKHLGSVPITVLNESESFSSHKNSLVEKKDSVTENTYEGSCKSNSIEEKRTSCVSNPGTEKDFPSSELSSSSEDFSDDQIEQKVHGIDLEEELGLSHFNESIELETGKSLLIKTNKHTRESILRREKGRDTAEKLSWKEKMKITLKSLWLKLWLWPNQLFLTYTKAHFVSLRYDFMDEVAAYDNYGSSFSTNMSAETGLTEDNITTSWLISLTDPTTSLVAGVYFTEYLRAKLLIMAVTLIRIPITTLTFILGVNLLAWYIICDYHNLILSNNIKHYISEPMICSYISVMLLCFSLIIWLRSWLIKRQLQPKNILEYLKMKYSLDIGMPLQEIEYEKIMPRYKIHNGKVSTQGSCSQVSNQFSNQSSQDNQEKINNTSNLGRLSNYLKIKLCGTSSPSLHDNLFIFKRNGPSILLRWFQASYFLQLILISIVIHLSYLQKKLWYEDFQLATFAIWMVFGVQNLCLPFIIYPILLCTSVGQMADKLVLEEVLSIQKTQNIHRLSQISEALRFYSFLHIFNSGNEENKELQRRKYSIIAKTAPWELQIKCRNTMNFLINNAPIRTQSIVSKCGMDEYTIKYFLVSEGLYYSSEHAKEVLDVFDFDKDKKLNENEFAICYHAIQQHFMGDLDVSLILNYLESNFGVNTASSTGMDLSTFTTLVKRLNLGWSSGQIRHAMIFLSGEKSLSSMYISSLNNSKKSERKRKNEHLLSVKVNDFINKLVTIEGGIPNNFGTSQFKSSISSISRDRNSVLSNAKRCSRNEQNSSGASNSICVQDEHSRNIDDIPIEEYIYSNSELEEEIIERV
ncbi:putative transmembrane protein [Cryptosporidium felis]|nr:putative transmembrane protein [Cryptosporidium felis]